MKNNQRLLVRMQDINPQTSYNSKAPWQEQQYQQLKNYQEVYTNLKWLHLTVMLKVQIQSTY